MVVTKNWKGLSSTPEDIVRNVGDDKEIVEQHPEGTIIRTPILLTPSEKLLLKYGLNSHVIRRRFLTFIYKTLSYVLFRFDNHKTIYRAAEKYLQQNKVDVIIATGEPFILFRYAHLLSKKFNTPWVADYRDGWYLNYVIRQQKGLFARLMRQYEKSIEKKLLKTVHAITSTDPILSSALGGMHQKPFVVVYNGFELFYDKSSQPTNELPLTLTHSGTLTSGQRAEVLLQAIKDLLDEKKIYKNEIRLQLIGIDYFPEQKKRFTNFVGIPSECIITTPRLNRQEVVRINQSSDYLLIFSDKKFKWISAKAYEYLACKRPILVMPDDYSIMASLVRKLNAGMVLNEVVEIKELLLKAIEMKRRKEIISFNNFLENDAMFYTRREQTKVLADYLNKTFV